MRLTSSSFDNGQPLPVALAAGKADGFSSNRNPQLAWDEVPEGTASFVLLCVDPDVPTVPSMVGAEGVIIPQEQPRCDFSHWVMVDIPADVREIAQCAVTGIELWIADRQRLRALRRWLVLKHRGIAPGPYIQHRQGFGSLAHAVVELPEHRQALARRHHPGVFRAHVRLDAARQGLGKRRILDHHHRLGVVVLAARIEVVGADHADPAIDHQ